MIKKLPKISGQPSTLKTHHTAMSGFKGERVLVACSLVLSIVSTILLIELTVMQRRHTKLELEEKERKAKEAADKNKKG